MIEPDNTGEGRMQRNPLALRQGVRKQNKRRLEVFGHLEY